MKKLRCILLDEDEDQLEALKLRFAQIPGIEVIRCFTEPAKLLAADHIIKTADLLLSDIEMPVMNGLDLARLVDPLPVLFVTGYPEKGINYSEIPNAIGAIRKPVNPDALRRIIEKHFGQTIVEKEFWLSVSEFKNKENKKEEKEREFTKKKIVRDQIALVQTNKILKIPSGDCHLVLADGRQFRVINNTISDLEGLYLKSDPFIRVHDSHIVNIHCIDTVEGKGKNELVLSVKDFDGKNIRCFVSDSHLKALKAKLGI